MDSFLIIGISQFGKEAALRLSHLGAEVLAVDIDVEKVDRLAGEIDVRQADCTEESTLQSLNIPDYDCVIVAISEDIRASVLISMMVKDHGAKYLVCQSYDRRHSRVLERIGADRIVCPEVDMGEKIAQQLSANGLEDYIKRSDDQSLVEIRVPEEWADKTLRELNVRAEYGVNVIAVKHGEEADTDLSPDERLRREDTLMIAGSNKNISRLPV